MQALMRIPGSLESLVEYGVVSEVVRPLMSGKEAQIYLVISGGRECVAKVYKEAQNRTFKNRAEYTEGRRTRNTRDQRAMGKRTKYGRAQDEAAWRSTEVDMIHVLRSAGVRVPRPHQYMDGVLLMELITDAEGDPAPRLGDLELDAAAATAIYDRLLRDVVRMLCAGVVHGDLSDFNVLMAVDGPVIIDLPQAVDAARNPSARKLLVRDVANLHRFLLRFVPTAKALPYAEEMWDLYERNALTPETPLTGQYKPSQRRANADFVLEMIDDATWDERRRLASLGRGGNPAPRQRRVEPPPSRAHAAPSARQDDGSRRSAVAPPDMRRAPDPDRAGRNSQRGDHQRGNEPRGSEPRGNEPRGREQRGNDQRGSDQRGRVQRGSDLRGPEQRGHEQRGHEQRGHEQRGHEQRGPEQRGHEQRGHEQRGHEQRGHEQRGPQRPADPRIAQHGPTPGSQPGATPAAGDGSPRKRRRRRRRRPTDA